MSRTLKVAGAIILAAYPFAVWGAISFAGDRVAGIIALGGIAAAYFLRPRTPRARIGLNGSVFLLLAVLALISVLLNDRSFLLASPVLISAGMLGIFGTSLRRGQQSVVERFARSIEGDLSREKVTHCRTVTKVWCFFFVVNGSICLWLATFSTLKSWGVYTGGISYAIMAALFGGEYAIRRIRFG